MLFLIKMENKKDIKDNCYLKMSMYLLNIFNKSKDAQTQTLFYITGNILQIKIKTTLLGPKEIKFF